MKFSIIIVFSMLVACAPRSYSLLEATSPRDAECRYAAVVTPPPYQSGLPGFHERRDGSYGSAYRGTGAGLLLVLLLDRWSHAAWRDEVYERCMDG